MGRAAVLIPSPNVAENHQYYNALELQKAGAAVVIEEKDLTGEKLVSTVSELLAEPASWPPWARTPEALGGRQPRPYCRCAAEARQDPVREAKIQRKGGAAQ